MKKIAFTIIAGCAFLVAGAQVKEGRIVYERKMNMHKKLPAGNESMKNMIPEFNTAKSQLLFSGDESVFKNLPEEQDIRDQAGQDGQQRIIFRGPGSADNETYKNYAAGKVVELRELGPKKYIIEDSLRRLPWKLTDATATIKGYNCKKATTVNRAGDNVVAWYTEDIAAQSGPDQFGGLPGMIIQLDIGDGWIVFSPLEIETRLDKSLVKSPSNGKKITRQEFQKLMDEAFGPGSGSGTPQIRIMTREN